MLKGSGLGRSILQLSHVKPIAWFPLSNLMSLWQGGKQIATAFYAVIMLPEGDFSIGSPGLPLGL